MAELVAWVCPNVCKMGFHLSARTSQVRQILIPNGQVALCRLPVVNFPQPSSQRKAFFTFVWNKQLAVYADELWYLTLSVPWEEFVPPALMLRNIPSPKFIYRLLAVLRINISTRTELTNSIMKCSQKFTTLLFNILYSVTDKTSCARVTWFPIGYHKPLRGSSKYSGGRLL